MKLANIVVIVLLLSIIVFCVDESRLILLKTSHEEQMLRESLTQCIISASERFFNKSETLTISASPIPDSDPAVNFATQFRTTLLTTLNSKSKWSLLVRNVTKPYSGLMLLLRKPRYYIVQIRDMGEFSQNLETLKIDPSWNPHAMFIIASTIIFNDTKAFALNVMTKLWKLNVIASVVLLPNPENNVLFNVYTWYPYEGGNCGKGTEKLRLIDTCSFGHIAKNVSWFGDKIPKVFNDCVVKVRIIDWPPYIINVPNNTIGKHQTYFDNFGLEINMLNLIADKLKLQMQYVMSDVDQNWGNIYFNGTATGNLFYLQQQLSDIAIGAYAFTLQRSIFFDNSVSYCQESLRWCVPYDPILVKWRGILSTMATEVWICVVVTYFMITVAIWFLAKNTNEFTMYKSFINCTQYVYLVLLGLPIPTQPRTNNVRYFLFLIMVLSLFLVITYLTFLTSVLTSRNSTQKIATQKDIYKNHLKTYFIPTTIRYFKANDSFDDINEDIIKNWRNCYNMKTCMEYVAYRRDSAACVPQLYQEYVFNRYLTKQRVPLLYCFKKNVVSYPVMFLMRKGFPLSSKFNNIISTLNAAGLFNKWEHDLLRQQFKNVSSKIDGVEIENDGTLNFDNLKIMFKILLIGHSVAFVVFILELGTWVIYQLPNRNLL